MSTFVLQEEVIVWRPMSFGYGNGDVCAYIYTYTLHDNNAFKSRNNHNPIKTPQLSEPMRE